MTNVPSGSILDEREGIMLENCERLETVLKGLLDLKNTTHTAANYGGPLEAKLEFIRLEKKLDRIYRELLLEIYAVEDANAVVANMGE